MSHWRYNLYFIVFLFMLLIIWKGKKSISNSNFETEKIKNVILFIQWQELEECWMLILFFPFNPFIPMGRFGLAVSLRLSPLHFYSPKCIMLACTISCKTILIFSSETGSWSGFKIHILLPNRAKSAPESEWILLWLHYANYILSVLYNIFWCITQKSTP